MDLVIFGKGAIRLLFIFFLVANSGRSKLSYFSINILGEFGLFYVSVILGLTVIGFEFFSYTSREYLQNDQVDHKYSVIKNHILFILINCIISLPIILLLQELIPGIGNYIYYFLLVLLFEIVSIESYKLLISESKILQAALSLFFRTGGWIIIYIISIIYVFL